MKAYLTKYALTEGIKEVYATRLYQRGRLVEGAIVDMHGCEHYSDWHRTHESAVQRAEEIRLSEIERLQNEINRLENLKF